MIAKIENCTGLEGFILSFMQKTPVKLTANGKELMIVVLGMERTDVGLPNAAGDEIDMMVHVRDLNRANRELFRVSPSRQNGTWVGSFKPNHEHYGSMHSLEQFTTPERRRACNDEIERVLGIKLS